MLQFDAVPLALVFKFNMEDVYCWFYSNYRASSGEDSEIL